MEHAPAFTETSPSFQFAVIVSEFAKVPRESFWAQENTLAGVAEEAQRSGRLFEGAGAELATKSAGLAQE